MLTNESCRGDFLFEFANITNGETAAEFLAKRKAKAVFFNEHSTRPSKATYVKNRIKDFDKAADTDEPPWCIHLGPIDPTTIHNVGGVGAAIREDHKFIPVPPKTKDFADYVDAGRAQLYACDIGDGVNFFVMLMYCYTGGHCSTVAL